MHKNIAFLSGIALYKKETKRFIKVYHQTLITPLITSLIYLLIFSLAIGKDTTHIKNIKFEEFIASGLIIMAAMQNAFANTSSSLVISKVMGTIIDYIIPPFSNISLMLALIFSGATRGIIVGILVLLSLKIFININIYNIFYLSFYLISAALALSMLGIITGIIADNYDQMSAITTYIITPLSFLSGTFYSTDNLPSWCIYINKFNPFFYMIDGFRYGVTSHHDANLLTGILATTTFLSFLFSIIYFIFSRNFKIKN